jgi:hypothetical protein
MKEKEKEIFIFTTEEAADIMESDYVDNMISQLTGQYTLIMTEDNKDILENEEGDAFMIMEYK